VLRICSSEMRVRVFARGLFAAAALCALYSAPAFAAQQPPPGAPAEKSADARPAPRTPDGHPDFNGFWRTANSNGAATRGADGTVAFEFKRPKTCDDDSCQDANQPSYKPQYMNEVKVIAKGQAYGTNPLDPQFECKPLGIPRGAVGTMQIVQSSGMIAILYEESTGPMYRTIYLDGRAHPQFMQPSYLGDSVGHWQGNALVVDVAGLNSETWLGGGLPGTQKYTSIHSDQEHVVERWTRSGDVITYEATVDDPIMLTKPWVTTPRHVQLVASKDDQIQEIPCVPDSKTKPKN
jgi:hypothetical protein